MLSIRKYFSLFSMQFMSFLCILFIQSGSIASSPFCNYHGKIIRAITSIDVPYMIVNEDYKNIYNGEGQTYDITSSTSGLLGDYHVLWILETHDKVIYTKYSKHWPYTVAKLISMTSLLTHNVAHSTMHSFRPKTNNQPIKKFLSLAFSWVKVVKNWTSF